MIEKLGNFYKTVPCRKFQICDLPAKQFLNRTVPTENRHDRNHCINYTFKAFIFIILIFDQNWCTFILIIDQKANLIFL